jgi:hypothetical protein
MPSLGCAEVLFRKVSKSKDSLYELSVWSLDLLSKKNVRLAISEKDMGRAVDFFIAAQKCVPTEIAFEALVIAGLIYYCRPFSSNEKNKSAAADSSIQKVEILKDLSDSELNLHNKLINLRNKAIAHSESEIYPVGLDAEKEVLRHKRYSVYPEFANLESVLSLAQTLHHRLRDSVVDCMTEWRLQSMS